MGQQSQCGCVAMVVPATPMSGVEWSGLRIVLGRLIAIAPLCYFFSCFVHPWPSHVAPGQGRHLNDSKVAFMELS